MQCCSGGYWNNWIPVYRVVAISLLVQYFTVLYCTVLGPVNDGVSGWGYRDGVMHAYWTVLSFVLVCKDYSYS